MGPYRTGWVYILHCTMMRKHVSDMEQANAASAAHWLKQGGFSWWRHVANMSNVRQSGGVSETVDVEECVEKPRGSRSNRKALAAQKNSPEFSDNSSDDEVT
ncbi:hypothetical protein T484DRAFT_1758182, partial [Baffinella frigidus]